MSPWQPYDNKLSVKTGKFLINKSRVMGKEVKLSQSLGSGPSVHSRRTSAGA
jgi:hypothetical protein